MLPWALSGWIWLSAITHPVAACSASSPCEVGCCSKFGNCGFGPDYCGADCVGQCSRKSQCDPGFGSQWAESSSCPLNVCCSKYGFCGTTKEFCGDEKVTRKICSRKNGNARVIGYYEGWAHQRRCNAVWPEQIPTGVYTHIYFAFATIDPETFEVVPTSRYDLNLYQRITALKNVDPGLKVFIAIGGWAFNDPGPTATTFSDISASVSRQKKFIFSLVSFLNTYGFDGVDLDWEYPGAEDRSGRSIDFKNFPLFLFRLKSVLRHAGKELSITLPASYWYLQHFDLYNMADAVDWFNVMSYDLHGVWDKGNKWTGNFLNAHTNLTEIDSALDLLWRNDIDPSKVVLGLAFYGRSFTVSSASCMKPGCTFESGGIRGKCSNEAGILLNSEIDDVVKKRGIRPKLNRAAAVKIASWDNQWVAYDDVDTFKLKSEYAQSRCLGGLMVWAISHDTKDAKYSIALAQTANRIGRSLHHARQEHDEGSYTTSVYVRQQCKWTNCGEGCPPGWTPVPRKDKAARRDEVIGDETGCFRGSGIRTFCCPPGKIPFCGWYSYHNGRCKGGSCPGGMKEIGSTSLYCRKQASYQIACCVASDTDGMAVYETAEWSTDADCGKNAECPIIGGDRAKDQVIAESRTGSGGSKCPDGNENRRLCANTRDPNNKFYDCSLYEIMLLGCPENKYAVGMERIYYFYLGPDKFRLICCSVNRVDVVRQINPEALRRRDALLDWLKNPTCPNPGSLLASMDGFGSITGRGMGGTYSTVEEILVALLLKSYPELKLKSATLDWNEAMSNSFAHFTMPEFGERLKKHPSYRKNGPFQMAHNVICSPESWNSRGSSKEIDCSECDGPACFLNSKRSFLNRMVTNSSPVTTLKARATPSNYSLERRAPRRYEAVLRSPSGERETIVITLPDYTPSSRLWSEDRIFDAAIDFDDLGDCGNAELNSFVVPDGQTYHIEHIIEGQQMRQFLLDASAGRLASGTSATVGAVPISFFRAAASLPRIGASPPPLPGGADYDRLLDRIMECLGSRTNTATFVLLNELINFTKGKLVKDEDTLRRNRWSSMCANEAQPEQFLLQIRRIISAINYLDYSAVPNVNTYLATIANNIGEQWQYAQQEWNIQHPNNQVRIAEFWSEWIKDYYHKWLIPKAQTLVREMITEMRKYWGVLTSDRAQIVLRVLDRLENKAEMLSIDTSRIN